MATAIVISGHRGDGVVLWKIGSEGGVFLTFHTCLVGEMGGAP